MNRTGDRFGPEGAWRGVGGSVKGDLLAAITSLASAYFSAKPLFDTALVAVPDNLKDPTPDHGAIPFAGAPRVTMERTDSKDGLLDVLGELDAEGDCEGTLTFMLTLEPGSAGGYHLWSAPTLVP